ncbi:type II toxin-antitoxin system VapC family toxin [Neobacillus drentensis]|uniref:type II toxin-antitoxin system VapC family toxin n=1 Tax=Neobacillus drentensis TaxID=220684 RepID=UPI0028584101|nr:PIN domain-containing protein [Neobacillus drentensis]MDR7237326.1 putative nucleic acid-binding protein [Neobacillus drentensis]
MKVINSPLSSILQASIYYVDACFLITLSQPKDNRNATVTQFIEDAGQDNATFAISNHVYTEVYNNIFKFIVKRALSTYRRHQTTIHKANGKTHSIPAAEVAHFIDLQAVQYLNKVASRNFTFYKSNPENLFVPDLFKVAKQDASKIQLLDCFYKNAKDMYDALLYIINSQGVAIKHLDSTQKDHTDALTLQLDYQLDSTDAHHLAIAINNGCDKFITLDGDFNHPNFVVNTLPITIDKIA